MISPSTRWAHVSIKVDRESWPSIFLVSKVQTVFPPSTRVRKSLCVLEHKGNAFLHYSLHLWTIAGYNSSPLIFLSPGNRYYKYMTIFDKSVPSSVSIWARSICIATQAVWLVLLLNSINMALFHRIVRPVWQHASGKFWINSWTTFSSHIDSSKSLRALDVVDKVIGKMKNGWSEN